MQFTFWEFFGQMSEDDKLVREWQVLYSENLDLTSNVDFCTTAPKPTSLFTTDDEIQAIYFIQRGIDLPVFWTDNKKIFLNDQEKYTANYDVRMFWSNSKYLYWLDYSEDIYRILLDDINWDWTDKVEACTTNCENDTWKGFVVEGEWMAFICYWTKLYEINNETWEISNWYTFLFDKVAWMVESREVIEIFQENWKVFTWDKVSETASSYDLWMKIAIVVQSANRKFIIWEWAVYIFEWWAKNKIAWQYNSDVLQQNKFKFRDLENSNVWFLKDVVFLWTDNIDPIESDDWISKFWDTSVIMLWNKKSWFPVWISKYINTSSDWSKYEAIYWMVTKSTSYSWYNDSLYIAYKNKNWVYWVDIVDIDVQNFKTSKEWILILPKFDWWNKNIEKKLTRIWIRADWGEDVWKFLLYKVEKWKLVPFNNDADSSFVKYSEWIKRKWLMTNENFYDITVAIVFKQDYEYMKNDALKLYSITLEYEPIRANR